MNRLEILESLVDTKKVFDVGCDHGLLSISLSKNHDVVASDISDSCVKKALENVKKAKAKVEVIKSDGLNKLDINKEDSLVIAGMGAFTILKILNNDIDKVPDTLIIQANNNHDVLRRNLVKMGYFIDVEKNLYIDRWYTIIRFKRGNRKYHKLDYLLGINPDIEYVKFNLRLYDEMLKNIPNKYFIKRWKIRILITKIKNKYNIK